MNLDELIDALGTAAFRLAYQNNPGWSGVDDLRMAILAQRRLNIDPGNWSALLWDKQYNPHNKTLTQLCRDAAIMLEELNRDHA